MVPESQQLDVLIMALNRCYGCNLDVYSRNYARSRVREYMGRHNFNYISEIIPRLLSDEMELYTFLDYMTINVTSFFREPHVLKHFREHILPQFKNAKSIKIWHIGSSSGEEPYTMGMILKEEGLLDKSEILATDICRVSLARAQAGQYDLKKIEADNQKYIAAGGKGCLEDHFTVANDRPIIKSDIRKKVTFANHNIISDYSISLVNIVFIRNVMIYFNNQYKDFALATINESLRKGGYLIIGDTESIRLQTIAGDYERLSTGCSYKKIG